MVTFTNIIGVAKLKNDCFQVLKPTTRGYQWSATAPSFYTFTAPLCSVLHIDIRIDYFRITIEIGVDNIVVVVSSHCTVSAFGVLLYMGCSGSEPGVASLGDTAAAKLIVSTRVDTDLLSKSAHSSCPSKEQHMW